MGWNKKDIKLNLIPIWFNQKEFQGSELPYEDDDQLKDLRDTYRDSHVLWRTKDKIYCAPIVEDAEELGKTKSFIDLRR